MDTTMDTKHEDYQELWAAKHREYDAKAERLDAAARLKYNDAFKNFSEEVSAAGDWTEASFKELTAKADRKWQELSVEMKDE